MLISIALTVVSAGMVFAGPNEGGVLVVHHDPELVLTDACAAAAFPDSCGELNATAAANGEPQLWFVLAAFPDNISDRMNTITFGLGDYDPEDLVMGLYGACDAVGTPIEIPGPGWPGPNTGTAVSWAPGCLGGQITPIYWLQTYAYVAGTIPLASHPVQGGTFVSCAAPVAEDSVSEYGVIGFGIPGQNPCAGDAGGDGPMGEDGPEGDNGPTGPEEGGDPESLPDYIYRVEVINTATGEGVPGVTIKATAVSLCYRFCNPNEACYGYHDACSFGRSLNLVTGQDGIGSVDFGPFLENEIGCVSVSADCWEQRDPPGWAAPEVVEHPSQTAYSQWIMATWEGHPTQGIDHRILVTHEETLAERFAPVLHKHPGFELQVNLADVYKDVWESGSEITGTLVSGANAYDTETIPPFHIPSHQHGGDCGDWCSYGRGTIQVYWWMDFPDEIIYDGASPGGRPLYFHVFPKEDGAIIQYWMWFTMNDLRQMPTGAGAYHEGDWEFISMKVEYSDDRWNPTHLNLHQHSGGTTFDPEACWWSMSDAPQYYGMHLGYSANRPHPHVWVAANSHAMYNRYQNVYMLDLPGSGYDFEDLVDFNISDNPRGHHSFFEYDALVNMGEFAKTTESHGCGWSQFGHWLGPLGGGDPEMETLMHMGWFGSRECPGEVPDVFCGNGLITPLGADFYTGARSPLDYSEPHEWREFTIDGDGWGNESHVLWRDDLIQRKNYLGEYIMSDDGMGEAIEFSVRSQCFPIVGGQARISREAGSSVTFLLADWDGDEQVVGVEYAPGSDLLTFSQDEVSGEGEVLIDVFCGTSIYTLCAEDLRLGVRQQSSASVSDGEAADGSRVVFPVGGTEGAVTLSYRGCVGSRVVGDVFDVAGRLVGKLTGSCGGGEGELGLLSIFRG
jgi:hypothetical protein